MAAAAEEVLALLAAAPRRAGEISTRLGEGESSAALAELERRGELLPEARRVFWAVGGGEAAGADSARVSALRREVAELRERQRRVDEYIRALHTYNEVKDVAQMLLGKLAEQEGVTTRDLYERYALGLED